MTDKTFLTEETSRLIDLTSDDTASSAADQLADTVKSLEAQIAELETENADLTTAADQEIADHNETSAKLATTEAGLLKLFAIMEEEYGLDLNALDADNEERELADLILAAQNRLFARMNFEAARNKAPESMKPFDA